MAIKKIMFENEVLEIGEINEKYNPTAVKKIEGIRPLWVIWFSWILWFVHNPDRFIIYFEDGENLTLITPKNIIIKYDSLNENTINKNFIIFVIIILLIIACFTLPYYIKRDLVGLPF